MDSQNRNEKKHSSSINEEVHNLLRKKGKISQNDFARLKDKYDDDDLVDNIQNIYSEKYTTIIKKAKKFARLIREKYANTQTPFHILLQKAIKYKIAYNLSDDEFAEFQRIYEQELIGNNTTDIIRPQTNIMKVLGGISMNINGFKKKLNDDDYKYLQEIMKLYSKNKNLHSQVILQSMQYTDCAYESLHGKYDRNLNNIGDHVHPVIVALFIPKINVVDEFFLWSNIAGIVKARFNNERLHSKADYELFHALVNDPNDIVCDNSSPILDLLNRTQLQAQLWNSVLNLRNGQYYNSSFRDFISSVDVCKLNKQDTPDLLYGRFDGVIIKRLLSAFSFRPSIVTTTPLVSTVSMNPYLLNTKPLVSTVPMINMRLSPITTNETPILLKDAINQTQFFLENGNVVPRHTSIIWSRGVLIFYVDRRSNTITYNEQLIKMNLNILPSSIGVMGGFEKINENKVIINDTLQIRDESFRLRSVVIAEINKKGLMISSSTLIVDYRNDESPLNRSTCYYCYDPYGPNRGDSEYEQNTINQIHKEHETRQLSFTSMAQTQGIVYIFTNNNSEFNSEFNINSIFP
jgi:hypothetical protein